VTLARKETQGELETRVSLVTGVKLVNLDFLALMDPLALQALPVAGDQLDPLDLRVAQ